MSQHPVRINGERITTSDVMVIRAPFDGSVIEDVPSCTIEHVNQAVVAATHGLKGDPLPMWRRAEILDQAAELLSQPEIARQFAESIALEASKPITASREEVVRAVSTFRFAAATSRTLVGEVIPLDASQAGEGRLGFTVRMPVGVVGAITPFNFPLNLVAHKIAPAIAAGCPVVLKPAHQAPLTAIMLSELLVDRCGLPSSWLHVLTGEETTVGAALVEHEDVDMLTFTGSSEVGWGIRAAAPRKKVSLELGNNSPVIVHRDCNWRSASERIAATAFSHAGQSCVSVQRILVHSDIAEPFTEHLVSLVNQLRVGNPLAETTQVSAVIDTRERDRIASWIAEAVAAGAKQACGGNFDDLGILCPTVLTNVSPAMKVSCEEVFGPVVGIQSYTDIEQAFDLANATRYELHVGVFTNDLVSAKRAVERLKFGGIIVNDVPTWRADQMPYGGGGDSGNSREGPDYAALEMTELRSVVLS